MSGVTHFIILTCGCNGTQNSWFSMYLSFGVTVQYVFGTAGKKLKEENNILDLYF